MKKFILKWSVKLVTRRLGTFQNVFCIRNFHRSSISKSKEGFVKFSSKVRTHLVNKAQVEIMSDPQMQEVLAPLQARVKEQVSMNYIFLAF